MRRKIGVFETEQQVIDCVHLLQAAGFVTDEMKVIAKDDEHSRRIEKESGIHASEVQEIAETREAQDNADIPLAATSGMGAGWNGNPALLGGYGFWGIKDRDQTLETLQTLGLSEAEAKLCRDEVNSGRALVVVETDESPTLFNHEGGPDLSRLGIAEGIYRQCNASHIV